jgi:prolyl oligopeptidase
MCCDRCCIGPFGPRSYAPRTVAERSYPAARRVDQVDNYHGTDVVDPFQWMENVADPELGPWLEAQADLVSGFMSGVGCRARFEARLREFGEIAGVGVPRRRGNRWFQSRPEGLVVLDDPEGDGRVVFDPSSIGDGIAIGEVEPSPDGSKLLWCETKGGSDWRTWRVLEVDTGRVLDDVVGDTKMWARWLPRNVGAAPAGAHAREFAVGRCHDLRRRSLLLPDDHV